MLRPTLPRRPSSLPATKCSSLKLLRFDRRWRPLPLLPSTLLFRALTTLPPLLLSSLLLTRPHNLPTITILDPLTLLVSLLSILTLLAEASLFRRRALTPSLTVIADGLLMAAWTIVLAGRAFLWIYTLDKKLCYNTPWLERDATLRRGCSEIKAGFAIAVVGVVAWSVATGVSIVVWRRAAAEGRKGGMVWRQQQQQQQQQGEDLVESRGLMSVDECGRISSEEWGEFESVMAEIGVKKTRPTI